MGGIVQFLYRLVVRIILFILNLFLPGESPGQDVAVDLPRQPLHQVRLPPSKGFNNGFKL